MTSNEKAQRDRYIVRLKKQIEVNMSELDELKFLHTFLLIDIIEAQEALLESLQDE